MKRFFSVQIVVVNVRENCYRNVFRSRFLPGESVVVFFFLGDLYTQANSGIFAKNNTFSPDLTDIRSNNFVTRSNFNGSVPPYSVIVCGLQNSRQL